MQLGELSFQEKRDWVRLIRTDNVGPITFRRLLERFGSAAAALEALPDLARRGGGMAAPADAADAEREIDALADAGAHVVALGEADYPPLLAQIEDAPPILTVLGQTALLKKRAVAVVGTRNASINGTRLARDFSAAFGQAGLVVVSGMARGVDAAAHEGALESGTIAVMAGGVDVIYPKENRRLYERIAETGALISEVRPGVQPQARHFPRRNRLISGIARGVVVVEAALRSGSLITARMALEQNREVFAVPGSPLDPRARGANKLIRDGAVLTETPEDVIEVLDGLFRSPLSDRPAREIADTPAPEPDGGELDTARAIVARSLGPAPVTVDEIIRQCQMSPAVVSTVLLELELAGRLERHPGNGVSVIGV
jgi:DNA processing protein